MRATSNVDARSFGSLTIVVSVDIVEYKGKYIQELHFVKGNTLLNTGYLWSSTAGPLVWELAEI